MNVVGIFCMLALPFLVTQYVPCKALPIESESASGQEEPSETNLFAAFVTDEVTPFSAELLCKYTQGLNEAQRNVCTKYPGAMPILQEVISLIHDECAVQMKGERWNCSSITPPVVGPQSDELKGATREAAFTHALTSAAMVYAITKACSEGRINNCGCDTKLNGKETQQGWQWGSCSDDVEFGATFARDFLDGREEETEGKSENEVGLSLMNLHNNAAGRMIVQNGMKLECRCHGVSGSCAAKTCWRKVPGINDIGESIKNKYDESIKVSVQITKEQPPSYQIRSVNDVVSVSTSHLVHLKKSQDYCSIVANFTQGRDCIPKSLKNAAYKNLVGAGGSALVATSLFDESLPACEDLCCNKEYTKTEKVEQKTCNCRFQWCCDVVCDECEETTSTYKCSS